jgi:3-oxoacyl-[acyl-carrier-protein] synthase-3
MNLSLERAGVDIHDVKKIFIHQANEKLDFEVIKRFYRHHKVREIPKDIMPMSIHKLGNSSVATVPTLFDGVRKKQIKGHSMKKGDIVMMASVGAGMNINSIVYKY